jgi:hypothetical protein
LSNLTTLMVSTENGDSILIANLQRDKKRDCFDRVVATINIVAHEKIVSIRTVATNTEKFNQIMELAMNVSTNCDWTTNELNV